MRVVLKAGFDRFSGYGNDAVDMAIALTKAEVDVLPMPTSILPGLPRAFLRLLEKDPRGRVDVEVQYAPPWQIKPWQWDRGDRKRVGWSMWERLPLTRADLAGNGFPPEHIWQGLDLMLVTCPMNIEAFRNVDEATPLKVMPTGINGDDWPVVRREPQGPMAFLMTGMLVGRKAPFTLLDAWREVKQERPDFDATLTLHTLAPGLHPKIAEAYPGVTISERPLDRQGLIRLYHDHDVLVSVSRGEGMNKPAMEFMATGGVVMASDWSGHQSWLHRDVAYPLPGTLVPAKERPEAVEFAVDKDALKAALVEAWENPATIARKGEKAAVWIRETHGWDMIADRLIRVLERL